MMLAKVCSDKNKPNGQYMIPPDRQAVMDFIQGLPIRKVWLLVNIWEQETVKYNYLSSAVGCVVSVTIINGCTSEIALGHCTGQISLVCHQILKNKLLMIGTGT